MNLVMRIFGLYQLANGLFGSYLLLNAIGALHWPTGSEHLVRETLFLGIAVFLWAFVVLLAISGGLLVAQKPLGRRLARITQILQIPAVAMGPFLYKISAGFFALVGCGLYPALDDKLHVSFNLGAYPLGLFFDVSAEESSGELFFGLNLIALVLTILLRPAKPAAE